MASFQVADDISRNVAKRRVRFESCDILSANNINLVGECGRGNEKRHFSTLS